MSIPRVRNDDEVDLILKKFYSLSEKRLEVMRDAADKVFGKSPSIIVGVNGSIARREATQGSDADYFILTCDEKDQEKVKKFKSNYRRNLRELSLNMPTKNGVFDDVLDVSKLLSNIGGEDDTNKFLTRRMLYLLEGEYIYNKKEFDKLRNRLIDHYVPKDLKEHKPCLYLLNDIIRYWRTICVDFEHKTTRNGKPRAIRLIKLRFSRMMLYFGGVAAITQTKGIPVAKKKEKLREFLSKHPIDRLRAAFGEMNVAPALRCYAIFLNALDQENVRAALSSKGRSGLDTREYKELRDVADEFRDRLEDLLVDKSGLREDVASSLLL